MNATANKMTVTCSKCSGRGKIERFAHYGDGICFQCDGTGVEALDGDAATIKSSTRKVSEAEAWISKMVGEMLAAMSSAGVNVHWASVSPSILAARYTGTEMHCLFTETVDAGRVAAWVAKYAARCGVRCSADVLETEAGEVVTLFPV